MPRAYTREPTRPDTESEQTHDDCEWLNEEDGEENVLGHWRDGYRCRCTPRITQDKSRDVGRQDHSDAEHRRSDRGHKRGVGLIGVLALSRGAAAVGLRLRQNGL